MKQKWRIVAVRNFRLRSVYFPKRLFCYLGLRAHCIINMDIDLPRKRFKVTSKAKARSRSRSHLKVDPLAALAGNSKSRPLKFVVNVNSYSGGDRALSDNELQVLIDRTADLLVRVRDGTTIDCGLGSPLATNVIEYLRVLHQMPTKPIKSGAMEFNRPLVSFSAFKVMATRSMETSIPVVAISQGTTGFDTVAFPQGRCYLKALNPEARNDTILSPWPNQLLIGNLYAFKLTVYYAVKNIGELKSS